VQKTISGVLFDTDRDEEIIGEYSDEEGTYTLRKTSTGAFYIHKGIMQVWLDGTWITSHDLAGAGIKVLPSPRMRYLDTIRPISREEALRWWVENFVPDEFKDDVLWRLPKIPSC
jgi:hypothetical protein